MNGAHQSLTPLLEIAHLEALVAIDQNRGLAEAAGTLNITPSALSHRVKEAERRLGIPLFARAHRRLEPTAAAAYLTTTATRLLEELTRAEADSRRMTGSVQRIVRIAVDTYRSYRWLPDFVRFVRAEIPEIELQVSSAGSEQATAQVEANTVDVAIAPGDRPSIRLEDRFLFRDELVFISHPDHPLASRDVVTGSDIEGVEFITYTRTPEPDREFARLFRPSNHYPAWIETVELPEAIVEMVAAGLGTSVLARWAIEDAITSGRVAAGKVGADGITIPWHAFHRRDDDDARAVVGQLVEWCARHGSLTG